MAITKPSFVTNTISSLDDLPNDTGGLTSAELKTKFDKAAVDIKSYLNDTFTTEVDNLNTENVKKTGDQIIQGVKTFESSPIVPTPTTDMQVSTKKYIDDHKSSSDHDSRYYTEAEIGSTTSGSSGAKKVGVTSISTLSGNDVQTVLESVKGRFDTIAETNVNAEVANTHFGSDGRTYTSQSQRLDGIDSSLAKNTNDIRTTQSPPLGVTSGAIITFVDDDCSSYYETIWKTIVASKNINISMACITNKIDTAGFLTLQQLKDAQTSGNDVVSHTMNHYGLLTDPDSYFENEYNGSRQWLIDNGFNGYDILVFPGGLPNIVSDPVNHQRFKNLARKTYKYSIDSQGTINSLPVDNWRIQRVNGDTLTESQLTALVDTAIANNTWLVVMNHDAVLAEDATNQINKIENVIDYCVSHSVPILKFSDAVKYKGNSVALGEFTDPKSTFISVNGYGKFGGLITDLLTVNNVNFVSDNTMDAVITTYTAKKVTIKQIGWQQDTLYGSDGGGTLITYRHTDDFYSYQTYTLYNSERTYKRVWNKGSSIWNPWKKISGADRVTTTQRNARQLAAISTGESIFDSTLGKPVWCKSLGVAEKDTLTITSGATASGNITITLNGVSTTVAVLVNDSIGVVGDKIRATAFSGWDVSGTAGSDTVVFTSLTAGVKTAPSFSDTGATGTIGSFVVTVTGTANIWVDATGATV